MEDKKFESEIKDWTEMTENLVGNMNSIVEGLKGKITEEQQKQIDAELDKIDFNDFQEQLKKAMNNAFSKMK